MEQKIQNAIGIAVGIAVAIMLAAVALGLIWATIASVQL